MTGGLDILLVGIAADSLDHIASSERLEELFGCNVPDDPFGEKHLDFVYALEIDPATACPHIFYFHDECDFGRAHGVGLGYLIFVGAIETGHVKLDERLFYRIPELKERFLREMEENHLCIDPSDIGVYAINVTDT